MNDLRTRSQVEADRRDADHRGRIAVALESIAASLEKLANPVMEVREADPEPEPPESPLDALAQHETYLRMLLMRPLAPDRRDRVIEMMDRTAHAIARLEGRA